VRIDDAGEHMKAARLDLVERFAVAGVDDGIEEAARDEDIGLANAFFGDDAPTADRQICGGRA